MDYRIDTAQSKIIVTATATLHAPLLTDFTHLSGTLSADASHLSDSARAEVRVKMSEFSSGDRVRDWKMKGELDPDRYPEAVFTLERVKDVRESGTLSGTALGKLNYRGRTATIEALASGVLGEKEARAEATFSLNLHDIAVSPPKFLFLKVGEIVTVKVILVAKAA